MLTFVVDDVIALFPLLLLLIFVALIFFYLPLRKYVITILLLHTRQAAPIKRGNELRRDWLEFQNIYLLHDSNNWSNRLFFLLFIRDCFTVFKKI